MKISDNKKLQSFHFSKEYTPQVWAALLTEKFAKNGHDLN
jgi:hypothetical protein